MRGLLSIFALGALLSGFTPPSARAGDNGYHDEGFAGYSRGCCGEVYRGGCCRGAGGRGLLTPPQLYVAPQTYVLAPQRVYVDKRVYIEKRVYVNGYDYHRPHRHEHRYYQPRNYYSGY